MQNLIRTLKKTTRLYKQPSRIGDVLEYQNEMYLIIGIQNVQIIYSKLEITYVCQNLHEKIFSQPSLTKSEHETQLTHFYQVIKTGKEHVLKEIMLGKLFFGEDRNPYQTVEFTDVEIEYTDIKVSFLAKPIRPVARKEAKAKLVGEKKKRLNLAVVD